MATAIAQPAIPAKSLPGRRYDHLFFSGMAIALLLAVFLGFAQTYYLAGVFNAPLPSRILHFHGAAFSCWILLLVTQTSLVSAGRVDIHRRLGIAGFLLACLMVVLGVLAASDSLAHRPSPSGIDPKIFYIVPITDMLIFSVLIAFAFRMRSNAAAHKRLIMIATVSLMIAAIARWPITFSHRNPLRAALISWVFLLSLMAYDYWSTRKVHRATLYATVFLIFIQMVRFPIAHTSAWQSFATWAQSLAR